MNALARRPAAIVSPIAGTTRYRSRTMMCLLLSIHHYYNYCPDDYDTLVAGIL